VFSGAEGFVAFPAKCKFFVSLEINTSLSSFSARNP